MPELKAQVILVLRIDPIDHSERPGIFSTKENAQTWMDSKPNLGHICMEMVVDVPEYGNEAKVESNG